MEARTAGGLELRERDGELRALAEAARSASEGRGRVVVVEGVAGVGKTALLHVGTTAARNAGLDVLEANGVQAEQALPFGVAMGLLAATLRAERDADRRQLLAGTGPAGPLLFGDGAPDEGVGLDAQMPVVRGLHTLAVNLSERQAVAIVVDDLHWVDAPSVRLLAYLGRRIADLPIFILAATRPAEPGSDQEVIDDLNRLPGTLRLRPQPLSAATTRKVVDALMGDSPTPEFKDACMDVTSGNPLLIRELIRTVQAEGRMGDAHDAARVRSIGVESLAWSTEATLRQLPEQARELMVAVCILGADADAGLAFALAGVDDTVAIPLVGRLQRAGLLQTGRRLGAAHPLVAQSLREALPAGERGLLHRRAARLLADRSEPMASAAHLMLAPAGGEPWAVQALVAAADLARTRAAPVNAVRLLGRALLEPPRPERLPAVLAASAAARAAAGDPAAAEIYEQAIAITLDRTEQARLLLALAWAHQAHGRFADAVAASSRGLALDIDDEAVAVELAAMHDAAVLWSPADAPGAARAVRPAGAPTARAERVVLADTARRRMFAGEDHRLTADLARQAWDEGTLLRESTADDPVLIRVLTVLHNADALTEALAVADVCLRDAADRSSPMAQATWRHLRGHVLLYMGELDEAERDLREAFTARHNGWGAWLPVNAGALVAVKVERDDLDGAERVLADARASSTHPAASPMWANLQAAAGRLALARGDASTAAAELLEAGRRGHVELGAINPALGTWSADAVLALRRLGRDEEALSLAERELGVAGRWGAPRGLSAMLRVRGIAGPPSERLELLRTAVDAVAASEAVLEHGHALVTLGEALLSARDLAAAPTLSAGLDLAEGCGAEALAGRATQGLRDLGRRPRRRRSSGPEALTVTERRVAVLAASGLSNRQIADDLFVTPKTVAFHLGNVYRKLNVAGRAELEAHGIA